MLFSVFTMNLIKPHRIYDIYKRNMVGETTMNAKVCTTANISIKGFGKYIIFNLHIHTSVCSIQYDLQG